MMLLAALLLTVEQRSVIVSNGVMRLIG